MRKAKKALVYVLPAAVATLPLAVKVAMILANGSVDPTGDKIPYPEDNPF